MKTALINKIAILLFLSSIIAGCNQQPDKSVATDDEMSYSPITEPEYENAVIYEANIRQYSEAGTFNEFTKDIPELKKLGVKVIWLMPIFPISEKNRKARGDLLVEDIKDEKERKKYLGSYYAVANYTEINPDLGTQEDLNDLIETAHSNGMYVILDWVANHTGWDNWWIEKHPEFYTQDESGNIIHPKGTDWTDTADLNYENEDLWNEMISSMKFWVDEYSIDGFRCDVAHEVPTEFWNQAVEVLEEDKPLFMLAESEKKDLFLHAFDMGYNWEGHHIMNLMAQGKENGVAEWDEYMMRNKENYQEDDFLMNFITNHDENSWNGTVKERMGKGAEAMLAFQYVIPGMPLIYSGQEYGLDKRLKFFEKDLITKDRGRVWELMERLGALKNNNPALNGGKKASSYERLNTDYDKDIILFKRSNGNDTVYYVGNFSENTHTITIDGLTGKYRDVTRASAATFENGASFTFAPFTYRVLEKVID